MELEEVPSPYRVWYPEDPEEFERRLTEGLLFPEKWKKFFKPKYVLPHSSSVEWGSIHGHYSAGFILTSTFWRSLETMLENRMASVTFLDFLNSVACVQRFSSDKCERTTGGGDTTINPCPSGACPGSWTCPGAGGDMGCFTLDLLIGEIACQMGAVPCDTSNSSCAEGTLDDWCIYLRTPIDIAISSCTNFNDPACGFDTLCDNDGLRITLGINRFAVELYAWVENCPGNDCSFLWDLSGCPGDFCDDYIRLLIWSSDTNNDGYGVIAQANLWPRYCLHENWGDCADFHDCLARSKFSVCACVNGLWLDQLEGRGCSMPVLGDTRLCLPTWNGCNCSCSCSLDDLGCCVLEVICTILDWFDFEERIMCMVQGKLSEQLRNAIADFSTFNTDLLCIIGEEVPGGDPTRTCPGDQIQTAYVAAYPQYCAARTRLYNSVCLTDGSLFFVEMAFANFQPDACVAGSPPAYALNVGTNACSSTPQICFPDICGYDVGFYVGKELLNESFYWLWVSGFLCNVCLPLSANLTRILFPSVQRVPGWPFDTRLCIIPYASAGEQPYIDITGSGQIILAVPRFILRLVRDSDGLPLLELHVGASMTLSVAWINQCHPLDPLCCETPSDPTCRKFQCEVCDNLGCPRYVDIPFPPGYLSITIENFAVDILDVFVLHPSIPIPPSFSYTDIADIIGSILETKSVGPGFLNWRPYLGFAGVVLQPVFVGIPQNSGAFVVLMDLTVECLNFLELLGGASPPFDGVENGLQNGKVNETSWRPYYEKILGASSSNLDTQILSVQFEGVKDSPLFIKSLPHSKEIVLSSPGKVKVSVGKLAPKDRKTVVLWKIKELHEHWRVSKNGNIEFWARLPGEKYTLEIVTAADIGKPELFEGNGDLSRVFLPAESPAQVTVWVGPRVFATAEKDGIRISSPDSPMKVVKWKVDGSEKWNVVQVSGNEFVFKPKAIGKIWIEVEGENFNRLLSVDWKVERKGGCVSFPLVFLSAFLLLFMKRNGKWQT